MESTNSESLLVLVFCMNFDESDFTGSYFCSNVDGSLAIYKTALTSRSSFYIYI